MSDRIIELTAENMEFLRIQLSTGKLTINEIRRLLGLKAISNNACDILIAIK